MGLFSKKTTIEVATTSDEKKAELSWILKSPRITEKAANLGDISVYTFNVHPDANKKQIFEAVKVKYNIVPSAIRTIVQKAIHTFIRGRKGMSKKTKKAYVTLPKGSTINLE